MSAIRNFINNSLLARKKWVERLGGTSPNKIDIDKEMGYPAEVDIYDMKVMYERFPISNRVVEVLPLETWKSNPVVVEPGVEKGDSKFLADWENLIVQLRGGSKFKNVQQGNPVWETLKRLDILRGIGEFGLLFFGLEGEQEQDLKEQVSKKAGRKLKFLRVFDQTQVDVLTWDQNPNSERFCKPELYEIEFSDPDDSQELGLGSKKLQVHHSRVLHSADNIASNELFGIPRQKPVWNRICDLRMLYGGSAMMLWKGGFPGISLETHPSLGVPELEEEDLEALRTAIDNYQNGLQRYLTLQGMAAKSLSPQVADPSAHIEIQIDSICIEIPIPKRVFMGSERGELASSQDHDAWNSFVQGRQSNNVTPTIVVPFIDKLVGFGVLTEPAEYNIEWQPVDAQTEEEKATVAIKVLHAMTKYVAGDLDQVMAAKDMFVKILHFSEDEATNILENAREAFADNEDRELEREILEAKLLRKHKRPMLSDQEKGELLDIDPDSPRARVEKDAVSDKFTGGSEGKKSVSKLTSTRSDEGGSLDPGTSDEGGDLL